MDLTPYLDAELPWVRWAAMAWIEGRPADDPERARAHRQALSHPRVRAHLDAVLADPWPPMKNHKQAAHPLHRLGLLVDLGLCGDDPEGQAVSERLLAGQPPEGPFELVALIPKAFGGSGRPESLWMACDAPLLLEAFTALGGVEAARLQSAADHLLALSRDFGWPCSTGPGFRGPGRKGDPCPYANLLALRALARFPQYRDHPAVRRGIEVLLSHWDRQKERKLYLFGIGTDYRKPKYPLVWYDLLHVLTVLARHPGLHGDPRLEAQRDLLRGLASADGSYRPTTVWMAYRGFDFAQKRGPSPMLTLAAARALGEGATVERSSP